jgi:hypothetical protein
MPSSYLLRTQRRLRAGRHPDVDWMVGEGSGLSNALLQRPIGAKCENGEVIH